MANVYVRSGASGGGTGADWTNAYTRLSAALTASAAGDSLWVSEDHAETAAATTTHTSPGTAANPCNIICALHTGSVPPVAADMRTTATVTTTGAFDCVLAGGYAYVYGITFKGGSGAVNNSCSVGSVGSTNGCGWRLDSCSVQKGGTTGGSVNIGPQDGKSGRVDLNNTTMSFASTGDAIYVAGGDFYWNNTASALLGSAPSSLLISNGGHLINIEGVDLSAAPSQLLNGAQNTSKIILKDCKLNASASITYSFVSLPRGDITLSRCDSGATNYRNERYNYCGNQKVNISLVNTGGASDNTTPISWAITTTANSKWASPFGAMPIAVWNDTISTNRVCTIQGIWNAAAVPNNDDIWVDFEYLGSSSTPLGSFASGTIATILTANAALTASTAAWDSKITARANISAYSLGDMVKVASNPGRVFFCTTAGTSAGSEPGVYATAIDGGSVTDSGAVFRAGCRFTLTATASSPQPGQVGVVYAYVKAAKASSTFYVDPLITLS